MANPNRAVYSFQSIVDRILALHRPGRRVLVTLDGPCASGKTTLARRLAEATDAFVVHTDHFVIPHAMKTPERLAIPGGNCDVERLVREVLEPWSQGRPAVVRKYDWHLACLTDPSPLPAETELLILEGSYCNLPALRKYASLRLFCDTPAEIRAARLRERETPESLRRFAELWIPLENAYFEAYHLPDEGCLLIAG